MTDGAMDAGEDADEGDEWRAQGDLLLKQRRFAEALALSTRALEQQPDDPAAWAGKARALLGLGRLAEALAAAEQALALDPSLIRAWDLKGAILSKMGRPDEALVCLDRAIELEPDLAGRWNAKGYLLMRRAHYDDALACYDHALQLGPDHALAAAYRAHILFRLGRIADALPAYDRALELGATGRALWYGKGMTLRRLRRSDEEALACFDRALELAPDDDVVAWERAAALYRLHRDEEALAAYDLVVKLAPLPEKLARLHHWRGMTLHRLHRNEEALAAYDQALALEDRHPDWWRERGRASFELRRYDESLANAERAIALDANNPDGWFLKGGALYHLGRYQEALAAYEHTLQLAPTSAFVRWNMGETLNALRRYEEAGDAFAEAARLRPDDTALQRRYRAVMLPIRRTTTDQRLKLRDGRWLGYLDYGDPGGVPIICCHGAPGSRLSFFCDPNLLLDLHLRLIVPDRPGYGLSNFQRRRRLLDWPGDVEQLADHLRLERFALLGVSAGGPHAAACAYAIPHRLTRVGLVSSAAPRQFAPLRLLRPRERISNIITRYLPWPLQWALYSSTLWLLRKSPAFLVRAVSERTIPADKTAIGAADLGEWPGTLPPAIHEEVLEPFRHGAGGHAWDVRICARSWRFRPDAIRDVAVYLWHGGRDQLVPVSAARALAAAIPGCRATFYPDEGHDLREHTREIFTVLAADERRATAG